MPAPGSSTRPPRWRGFAVAPGTPHSRPTGHRIPDLAVPFAYQPVVGYIAAAVSLLSGGFLGYAVLWGIVISGAAALGAFTFAREVGPRRTLVYWACAPQLLLFSGINF